MGEGQQRMYSLCKDDKFSSMIAIFRSATVFDYNEQAKATARERILKSNQHMTTGQIGTRTHKKSGEIETSKNELRDVRGQFYSILVIAKTIERNKKLLAWQGQEEQRREIKQLLAFVPEQFRSKRTESTIERYSHILFLTEPSKPQNAMQQQTGFDTTTHMLGQILYSSLRVIHIPLVRDEILFHAGKFDNSLSIRALVLILKELDLAAQKKLILDQT